MMSVLVKSYVFLFKGTLKSVLALNSTKMLMNHNLPQTLAEQTQVRVNNIFFYEAEGEEHSLAFADVG